MPVYSQGDLYEEDGVSENHTEEPAHEPQKVEEPKKKKLELKKPNVKLVLIIAGCAILLCVIGSVGVLAGNKRRAAEESKEQQEIFEHLQEKNNYYKDHPEADSSVGKPTVDEVMPTYSNTELKALRKWGYTASEIDIASRDGLSAQSLVDSARADREEAQKEALKAVSDTASPEYKKLLDQTWLGGDPLDVSGYSSDALYSTNTRVEIVDYDKCEPHGQQLFLKLHLNNGVSAFMSITPMRFNELPESGNIVVEIADITMGDVTVITNVIEQRVN